MIESFLQTGINYQIGINYLSKTLRIIKATAEKTTISIPKRKFPPPSFLVAPANINKMPQITPNIPQIKIIGFIS